MTANILEYKNFIGSVNYSDVDECFYGKIEDINDLVRFEGTSVKELKKSLKDAVNDYIDLCKELNKEPYKSLKGSFNIRIEPMLHYSAIYEALKKGISQNHFVAEAFKNNVNKKILNHS